MHPSLQSIPVTTTPRLITLAHQLQSFKKAFGNGQSVSTKEMKKIFSNFQTELKNESKNIYKLYKGIYTTVREITGGVIVDNQSDSSIFVKPEDNTKEVVEIKAGEKKEILIDGICIPSFHLGRVFKVADDIGVTVSKKGDVLPTIMGRHSKMVDEINNFMGGRWLTERPDDGWMEIFKKCQPDNINSDRSSSERGKKDGPRERGSGGSGNGGGSGNNDGGGGYVDCVNFP